MKATFVRHRSILFLFVAALGALALVWGCSGNEQSPVAPGTNSSTEVLDAANPRVQAVMAVQDRHTKTLLAIPDVVGTATTLDENGNPAIAVYVTTDVAMKAAPAAIEDVPVVLVYTDPIVPMKGGGVSHTAIQAAPIQLGTSGGWRYDLANGYCCGGTLGSLIQKGGAQYVLSNYHVLASDIVNGGNGRVATTGDPVIQPGLIDVGCNANSAQNVATLSLPGTLPDGNGNAVDAAIAQVIPGMVRTDGAILEVGTISASTVAAFIDQAVKKSGRTTGLSRARVSAINGTFNIQYENECAGGTSFVQLYTNQIVTTNKGSRFLAGGDSGSLMVEDVTTNPRAVGLLFAGSSTIAIANPIGLVLSELGGAQMVGN